MPTRPSGTNADIFQAPVEYSSDAIALLDAEGVMRFTSRSSERILGYTPEAGGAVAFTSSPAQGTTFEVLLPVVEETDRSENLKPEI